MESDEQCKAHVIASFWTNSQNPKMQEHDENILVRKSNFSINTKGKRVYVDDNFVYPPGYRFCPHDEELIVHYLKKKVMNELLPHDKIKEVNLYKHSPQELSENYSMLGEKEWYFFTPRDRKYPNGDRPNRAAGTGYWKATGADKPIKHNNVKVGFRKALVFYEGKPPKGDKTNWIMHEFRVNESRRLKTHASDMRLDDWVLCRIYKKIDKSSCKVPRKEEHEQEDASKSSSSVGKMEVETCDYEGTMYSCGELVPRQRLELPHHITDPNLLMDYNKYSLDNFSYYGVRLSDYEMNPQSSLSSGNMYHDNSIFPMNFDMLDPYDILGEIESHNVLNIGVLDENSSIDKD